MTDSSGITHEHLNELKSASKAAFEKQIKDGPRTVYLAWRVINIFNMDPVDGTVDIDVYLYSRWFDPSMKGRTNFHRTAEEYEMLWNPRLEINNGENVEQLLGPDFAWNFKKDQDMMKYTHRFRGTINIRMDVRNFPFDWCTIPLSIGCKVYGDDKVVLLQDPEYEQESTDIKHKLMDWFPSPQKYSIIKSSNKVSSQKTYSNLTYSMTFMRRYGFYLYKVALINLILSVWSWCVFWMDPREFGQRIDVSLTLFLANVAFLFVSNDKLPKVDYLTAMDKLVLWSFITLFLTGLESFIVHMEDDDDRAKEIDCRARIFVPVLHLAGMVVFFGWAFLKLKNKAYRISVSKNNRVHRLEDN